MDGVRTRGRRLSLTALFRVAVEAEFKLAGSWRRAPSGWEWKEGRIPRPFSGGVPSGYPSPSPKREVVGHRLANRSYLISQG